MGKPNGIRTGRSVAGHASRALRSGSASNTTKKIAASALGNRARQSR